MRYQTSFYMNIVNYVKLAKAASRTGLNMQDLIIQAMYKYVKDYKKIQVANGLVQYQPVDKSENWRIFRVALAIKDYELFTDMRKVMKKSVSYLVALAIKKYLNKIVSELLKRIFNFADLIYDSKGKRLGKQIRNWIFTWKIVNRFIK